MIKFKDVIKERQNKRDDIIQKENEDKNISINKIKELSSRINDIIDTANYSLETEDVDSPIFGITDWNMHGFPYNDVCLVVGANNIKRVVGIGYLYSGCGHCYLLTIVNGYISFYTSYSNRIKGIGTEIDKQYTKSFVEKFDEFEKEFYERINDKDW